MPSAITFLLLAAACLSVPPKASRREAERPRGSHNGLWVLVGVFAGCLVFFSFGSITLALAIIIVGVCATWYIRDVLAAGSRRRGQRAVAAFLSVTTADLRAGATLAGAWSRGVEMLPDTAPPHIRQPLAAASVLARRGGSIHSALADADPELKSLGELARLSEQHGIALAGLLEQAANRLDTLRRHTQETAASLQGPQATALVLTCLPLAGIGMGSAMGADPLGFLLGGGLGGVLLVVGTALSCGGFAWSRLIIRKAAP